MKYLEFDVVEGTDGLVTFEAMASTRADAHAGVLAEAREVIDWASRAFPDTRGPVEDSMDWDGDILVAGSPVRQIGAGAWSGRPVVRPGMEAAVQ